MGDITKPEGQRKAEDRSVRLRNTWNSTEGSKTRKDTEEEKQCQRKGRNGKTNDPKKQDKALGNGSESDNKNEMREGEWIIELACAKSELVYKAGTKPSIQEMMDIFDLCSFEYGP